MIKAILFDIDGTLLDSNDAHAESFVEAFKNFDKTVSFVELKWLIGMGADLILEKYLSKNEIKKFGKDLLDYRKRIFLEKYLPEVETISGVKELFKKLYADKFLIALASSASDEELEKYKNKLKVSKYLSEETTADDAENAKPAPDIFQAALQKLKNVEKSEALIIGDTPYDAEAAVKAKIRIIGVKTGGWSEEKLESKGCAEVYENITEIYKKYGELFG